MADNILDQLRRSATESRTFADRLRDEREARGSTLTQFTKQTQSATPFESNGVPLQPSRVSASNEALLRAVEQAISPYSPELELKARGQESDILADIAKLTADSSTGTKPTISEQLALMKAGYQLDADGNLIKDAQEIGEDEVKGVSIIDSILKSSDFDLAGSTGRVKAGKLFNFGDTAKLRNQLNQLSGVLQLASAGKLKGQGQISEGERKILSDAVSSLGLSEKGTTDLSVGELRSNLEQMRVALAKKSNDPELIKKYGVESADSQDIDISAEVNKYW